jgi:hypothetical protein
VADNGAFVIAWTSSGQDGFSDGIFARRYDAAGAPQGDEFLVNVATTRDQTQPALATNDDGSFVIAWHSEHDGPSTDVYARRYSSSGVPLDNGFRVNTYTTDSQASPSVALDADGDFLIAWDSDGQDGAGPGIYAQQFDAGGVAKGEEFRVNSHTPAHQAFPTVATDDDGDAVIVWESLYQDGSRFGVYAQRYTVPAAVTASEFLFATAPHRLRFTFDRDVGSVLGTDDVFVENLTTGLTVPASSFSLAYDATTHLATFTYTNPAGLPDGRYRATLLASGTTLPANHVFEFTFLRGDANGDGRVNLNDFNILAANFGQSPRDFTQGDFDYSGNVNLSDFNILAGRFGTALLPGSRAPSISGSGDVERDELDELR